MYRSFPLLLLLCFSLSAQAQVEVYVTGVRHDSRYPYKLISNEGDVIRVESNGDGGGMISEDGHQYFYKHGDGRKKDKFGFKEKHTRYLINENGERLLTYYVRANRFLIPDESWIKVINTETGWTFEDLEGNNIAILDYEIAYENYWEFEFTITQQNEYTDLFKKYMALAMPMWALHEKLVAERGPLNVFAILEVADALIGW